MGGSGSASAKYTQNRTNQTTSEDATFGKEGQDFLSQLQQGLTKQPDEGQLKLQQGAVNKLSQAGGTVDKSALLEGIRRQSDAQTQVDIANGRSKFYNAPVGRNDINLADTVSRNAATRDSALASAGSDIDKFNAQQQNARDVASAQAALQANPVQSAATTQQNQLLQALGLLKGTKKNNIIDQNGTELGAAGAWGVGVDYCWVAREVFGDNGTWKTFRLWLLSDSPKWFFKLYVKHGEGFARWLKNKPLLKSLIKKWMDKRVENYTKELLHA